MLELNPRDRQTLLADVCIYEHAMYDDVGRRTSELRADIDRQIAAVAALVSSKAWTTSGKVTEAVLKLANRTLKSRFAALGIPDEFAPSLRTACIPKAPRANGEWRRALRRVAGYRIESMRWTALTLIAENCLKVQQMILAGRLSSDAAHVMLQGLPTAASLMPVLTLRTICADIMPEQLT